MYGQLRPLFPLPEAEFRGMVVELIEEGRQNEALEMLRRYYGLPNDIRFVTPEELLVSPEIPDWARHYAFLFVEWKELAERYPKSFREWKEWYEVEEPWDVRVGWWLTAMPEAGLYKDYIIGSEKYARHPELTLHEFWHLYQHYAGIRYAPNGARISDPATWDEFTRAFLAGTGKLIGYVMGNTILEKIKHNLNLAKRCFGIENSRRM